MSCHRTNRPAYSIVFATTVLLVVANHKSFSEKQAFCHVPEELYSATSHVAVGGTITYTCRKGFAMPNNSSQQIVAVCQNNGNWTQDLSLCEGRKFLQLFVSCKINTILLFFVHYPATQSAFLKRSIKS